MWRELVRKTPECRAKQQGSSAESNMMPLGENLVDDVSVNVSETTIDSILAVD